MRIDAHRCAGVESENIFPALYPEIRGIIIGGVSMLCLAVIGQDDGDILIGKDPVSEGAGEYMY